MTIEFALRRRALLYRCMASVWLLLTVIMLFGMYLSFPSIVTKSLVAAEAHLQTRGNPTSLSLDKNECYAAIAILVVSLIAIGFASFILSRSAFVDFELAAKYQGLADAMCIAGKKIEDLEKAVQLFVPKSKRFGMSDFLSKKDRDSFMGFLNLLRIGK